MMRSIITIACGLMALATTAIAADMPVKAPPPPQAPVYAWTGCYLGSNFGWARAETRFRFNGLDDGRHSADGFAGGGQVGCDYQFASSWVIGIQGMIDGTEFDRSHVSVLFPADTFPTDSRWFATVTGRIGFLVGPAFLVYGKGGWGTIDQRFRVFGTTTNILLNSVDERLSGADAGAGFEWMFAPNWSVWVEWDHIFVKERNLFFPALGIGALAFNENLRRDFDKVLFGINWRFGGPSAPVRASY